MTLTLDVLPDELRRVGEMIDDKKYFSTFDEQQLRDLAAQTRAVSVRVGEADDDLLASKAAVDKAAAGKFYDGLYEGLAESAQLAGTLKTELESDAVNLEKAADRLGTVKAKFFKIVLIYWQQAQYYGCKDPSSVDALLRSNTTWVLENARDTWHKLVENYDV